MSVSIGENIRKYREEQGIPLKSLSSGICSVSQLSKIEMGKAQLKIGQLEMFATRLGVTTDMLRSGNPHYNELDDSLNMITNLRNLKKYPEAFALIENIKEQVMSFGNAELAYRLIWEEGYLCLYTDQWDRLIEQYPLYLRSDLPFTRSQRSKLLGDLAQVWMISGNMEEAYRAYRKAVEMWEELSHLDPQNAQFFLDHCGMLMRLRRFQEALYYAELAYRLFDKGKLHLKRVISGIFMGFILRRMGELDRAISLLNEVLEDCEANEFFFQAGYCAGNLGCYYLEVGDLSKARHFMDRGLQTLLLPFLQGLSEYSLAHLYLDLALLEVRSDRFREAERYFDLVENLMSTRIGRFYEFGAQLQKVKAELARARGQVEEQLSHLRRALDIYVEHFSFYEANVFATEIAELLESRGEPEALEMYRLAIHYHQRFEQVTSGI